MQHRHEPDEAHRHPKHHHGRDLQPRALIRVESQQTPRTLRRSSDVPLPRVPRVRASSHRTYRRSTSRRQSSRRTRSPSRATRRARPPRASRRPQSCFTFTIPHPRSFARSSRVAARARARASRHRSTASSRRRRRRARRVIAVAHLTSSNVEPSISAGRAPHDDMPRSRRAALALSLCALAARCATTRAFVLNLRRESTECLYAVRAR